MAGLGVQTLEVAGLVRRRVQVRGLTGTGVDCRAQFRRVGLGDGPLSCRDKTGSVNRRAVGERAFGVVVGRVAYQLLELERDAFSNRELDTELGHDDFSGPAPRLGE
ncbi:MAG: hypothetical protein ACRDVO_17075 [Jiangellaceae bacterium]